MPRWLIGLIVAASIFCVSLISYAIYDCTQPHCGQNLGAQTNLNSPVPPVQTQPKPSLGVQGSPAVSTNQSNQAPTSTAPAPVPMVQDEQQGPSPSVEAEASPWGETQSASLAQTVDDPIVYVTRTGSKYHSAGCRYLAKSSIPMKLSEARLRYGPCSVCNPPVAQTGVSAPAPSDQVTPSANHPAAENGSQYGEISPATGKPKTTYVHGYTRKDGTYVRSHYRSK